MFIGIVEVSSLVVFVLSHKVLLIFELSHNGGFVMRIKQLIAEELEAVLVEMTRAEVYKHGETKGYKQGYKDGVEAGIKQALKFIQAYKTAEKGYKTK